MNIRPNEYQIGMCIGMCNFQFQHTTRIFTNLQYNTVLAVRNNASLNDLKI